MGDQGSVQGISGPEEDDLGIEGSLDFGGVAEEFLDDREYEMPRVSYRQPHLTLVEPDFLDSMGNIPQAAWELMGYLDNEAVTGYKRVLKMKVAPEHEELRIITLEKWKRVIGYIDSLLTKSGSVHALRSWQTVQMMENQKDVPVKATSTVVPEVPGQEKRGKVFGVRRG